MSRVAAGSEGTEGGWYEIRGEKNDVIVGPEGMSKVELTFVHRVNPRPSALNPKPQGPSVREKERARNRQRERQSDRERET